MKYSIFTFTMSIIFFLALGTLTFAEDIYFYCNQAGQFKFQASVKSHEWRINQDNNQWVGGKLCTFHVSGGGAQTETKREYMRNSSKCPTKRAVSYFEKGSQGSHCLKVVVSGYSGSVTDLVLEKTVNIIGGTPDCNCFNKFTKEDFIIDNQNPGRIEYNPNRHLLTLFYPTTNTPPLTDAVCLQDCYPVDLIKKDQIINQIKWCQPFNDFPLPENYDKASIKTPFGIITKSPSRMNLRLTDIQKPIKVILKNIELAGNINYSIIYPKFGTNERVIFNQNKHEWNNTIPSKFESTLYIQVPKRKTLNQWKLIFNSEKYHFKECNISSAIQTKEEGLVLSTNLELIKPKNVSITLTNTPEKLKSTFFIKDKQENTLYSEENTDNKFLVPLSEFLNDRAEFCEIHSQNYVLKTNKIIDLKRQIKADGNKPSIDIELQRSCVQAYKRKIDDQSVLKDLNINGFNIKLYDHSGTILLNSKIADFKYMDNRAIKYLIEDTSPTFPKFIFDSKAVNATQRNQIIFKPKNQQIQARFSLQNILTDVTPEFYLNGNKVNPSFLSSIYTVKTNVGLDVKRINCSICIPGYNEINETFDLTGLNNTLIFNCTKAKPNIIISLYGYFGKIPDQQTIPYNFFVNSINAIKELNQEELIAKNVKIGIIANRRFEFVTSLEKEYLKNKTDESRLDYKFSEKELPSVINAFNNFNPTSLCKGSSRSKILILFLPERFSDSEIKKILESDLSNKITIFIITPMDKPKWSSDHWKKWSKNQLNNWLNNRWKKLNLLPPTTEETKPSVEESIRSVKEIERILNEIISS